MVVFTILAIVVLPILRLIILSSYPIQYQNNCNLSGLLSDTLPDSIVSESLCSFCKYLAHKRGLNSSEPSHSNLHQLLCSFGWVPPSNSFSLKSWNCLHTQRDSVPWHSLARFKYRLNKHAFIMQLVLSKGVSTIDMNALEERFHLASCSLYMKSNETRDHLFCECPYNKYVWNLILQKYQIHHWILSFNGEIDGYLSFVLKTCALASSSNIFLSNILPLYGTSVIRESSRHFQSSLGPHIL